MLEASHYLSSKNKFFKTTVIQTAWYWHINRKQTTGTEKSSETPHIHIKFIFAIGSKTHSRKRTV
jgi:hypothetical protein